MRMMVFAVRDAQLGAFLEPIFALSEGVAMRSFSDAVLTPDHQFGRHAQDYGLFYVGMFDQDSGALEAAEQPRQVCTALQMKQMANKAEPARNGRRKVGVK